MAKSDFWRCCYPLVNALNSFLMRFSDFVTFIVHYAFLKYQVPFHSSWALAKLNLFSLFLQSIKFCSILQLFSSFELLLIKMIVVKFVTSWHILKFARAHASSFVVTGDSQFECQLCAILWCLFEIRVGFDFEAETVALYCMCM